MTGREVAGRRFANDADYQAACRDQKRIERIKKEIDFGDPKQAISFYQQLASGAIKFESVVGNDFDDEVYELVQKYKKEQTALKDTGNVKEDKRSGKKNKEKQDGPNKKNKNKKIEEDFRLENCDPWEQAAILTQLRKKARIRTLCSILIALVAIFSLGYFGVYSHSATKITKESRVLSGLKNRKPVAEPTVVVHLDEEEDVQLELLDEYKNLYIKNKSIIGWLKIDDTIIDYPVMQTSNNEYFLTHNFDGDEDKNGCLFLDKDCDVVHRNDNLIIYGHHMKSGKMFGQLDKYKDMKFYEKHPLIQFDSIYEKGVYQVMYVFRDKVHSEEQITFKYYQFLNANSEDEFRSNMQEMAMMSLYHTGVEASYGDQLLTLSTCDHSEKDGRFVVVAKRIE